MDAKAHSEVWRAVGDDLGLIAGRVPKEDPQTKRILGSLALAATTIGIEYLKKSREEASAGTKV